MLPSSSLPASSQDGGTVLASKPQNSIFIKIFLWEYLKNIIPQYYFPYKFPVSSFKELQKMEQMHYLWLSVWLTELQDD